MGAVRGRDGIRAMEGRLLPGGVALEGIAGVLHIAAQSGNRVAGGEHKGAEDGKNHSGDFHRVMIC